MPISGGEIIQIVRTACLQIVFGQQLVGCQFP